MKTFNNLLESSLTPQKVCKCMLDAAKGKLRRREVLDTFRHFDKTYETVTACARSPDFVPREDNIHRIADGTNHKVREIEKPMFCPEQILHHLLMEPFQGIVMRGLYEQVYGCMPKTYQTTADGKVIVRKYGPHAAIHQLKKWVQVDKKIYVAELDVHHAYDSVDIAILMQELRRVIKDEAWLNLIGRFLHADEPGRKGLKLGHYTSPWLFNFYLKRFDHFAAALDGIRYLRFADNLFLVGSNKRRMHRAVDAIRAYLRDKLKLELNRSAQVYRFEYMDRMGKVRGRAVNALGAVIHYNRVTLRKQILRGMRRKATRIGRKERVTWYDAASIFSRIAWVRHTDTYGYYQRYIKPHINTRQLKQKLRNYSRASRPAAEARRKIVYDGLDKSTRLTEE